MVFYLLVVALTNLAIGYVLAVLLGHTRTLAQSAARHQPLADARLDAPALPDPFPEDPFPEDPSAEQFLEERSEAAGADAETAMPLAEAAEGGGGGVVKGLIRRATADVHHYRRQLLEIDAALRRCRRDPQPEHLRATAGDLQQANDAWLRCQRQVAARFVAKHGDGKWAEIGGNLAELLLEHVAQAETCVGNIQTFDPPGDPAQATDQLILEVARLLDACHRLRDRMCESLLAMASQAGGLEIPDQEGGVDEDTSILDTGILNRTGMDRMVSRWRTNSLENGQEASLGVVDVDRLGWINEQYGPQVGDEILDIVGELLEQSLRHRRGFDAAAWFGGGSFVAFLGDTSAENAACVMERLRQTVVALAVRLGEARLEVRVTCGVTAVEEGDSSFTLFQTAQRAIREAKRAGRSHTVLSTADGSIVVEPSAYRVPARTIQLESAGEPAA